MTLPDKEKIHAQMDMDFLKFKCSRKGVQLRNVLIEMFQGIFINATVDELNGFVDHGMVKAFRLNILNDFLNRVEAWTVLKNGTQHQADSRAHALQVTAFNLIFAHSGSPVVENQKSTGGTA